MRVLVSGDRGYLRAVMTPMLIDRGHQVVGLDAGWYDGCDFGEVPANYELRTGDIRSVSAADVTGFDAVIHLAAISNDPVGHLSPRATYSVNADGAVHMAYAAGAAPDKRDYRVDFTKITTMMPAFTPEWTIAKGIGELATDMTRNGQRASDFEGARYVRLAKIRALPDEGRLEPRELRLVETVR